MAHAVKDGDAVAEPMRLVDYANHVLEQDRIAVENLPDWPAPENLYQHDLGVARLRRLMRRTAEAQLEGLAGSEKARTA